MLLDKVSFSVDPGQCWGIVGPNGVGKSTLMKTLSGLVVPDSGKVVVTPSSSTVGYLSQEPDRQVGEDVRAYLARRTGVTAANTALDAATMALWKQMNEWVYAGFDVTYHIALEPDSTFG
jgi:ATPase subunit of ABC transporter with duplicated ATPase domains